MNDEILVQELLLFYEVVAKRPFTSMELCATYEVAYNLEMLFIILDLEEHEYDVSVENTHRLLKMAFPEAEHDEHWWLIKPRFVKGQLQHMEHLRNARTRIRHMYIDIALKEL